MAQDFSSQAVADKPDFSAGAVRGSSPPDFSAGAVSAAPDFSAAAQDPDRDAKLAAFKAEVAAGVKSHDRADTASSWLGAATDAIDLLNPVADAQRVAAWLTPGARYQPDQPIVPPGALPDVGAAARQYLLDATGPGAPSVGSPNLAPDIAQGAGDWARQFASGLTTPGNLLSLPLAAEAGAAGQIARTGFALPMLAQVPDAAARAGELSVTGTTAEKTAGYLDLGTLLALNGGLAAGPEVSGALAERRLKQIQGDLAQIRGDVLPAPAPPAKPGFSEFGGDLTAPADFSAQAAPAPVPTSGLAPGSIGTPPGPAAAPAAEAASAVPPHEPAAVAGSLPRPVSSAEIATRPDLMQFKQMDDTTTGVDAEDKLAGQWDPLKGGNLLLWEPNDPAQYGLTGDERYIVANGHHRFEFGERQDVAQYSAQVIREADGYSAQDARALGAEINIADGKGTIYDQAKYFRNAATTYGTDDTVAAAGRTGAQGRQAYAIAQATSPDTWTSFINEQITPDQAEAIAKAAPVAQGRAAAPPAAGGTPAEDPVSAANASLQRLGIKQALAGDGPQAIANLIQAVRTEAGTPTAEQFDLFGADDTALQSAQRLASVATRIQGEVSREIRATDSAARSATTARAKGIRFDRPPEEILAENAQLKAERARWENWAVHPDLVAQVRGYADMAKAQGKPGRAGAPPPAAPVTEPAAAPATPTLDQKLQSLKIDTEGKLFDAVQGIPVAVWNGAIDAVRLALRAGKAVGQAIEDGLAWLKQNHPGVTFDENEFRAQMVRALGGRERVAKILGGDASPAVKAGAAGDAFYQVRTFDQLEQEARRILALGPDEALAVWQQRPPWLQEDTRNALGAQLERHFAGEEMRARAAGDTAKSDAMVEKQLQLWRQDAYATEQAQALNSRKLYADTSPAGKLKQAQELFDASGERVWKGAQPAAEAVRQELDAGTKAAADQLRHDPAANAAAAAAVDEAVKQSPDVHRAVIMDLGEEWSKSPFIVEQTRKAVGDRADEILSQTERPPQISAATNLRNTITDLHQRAAAIANGHFQGAEPGKTLSQKFQERLGLAKPQADRLARVLEDAFSKSVEKAKGKLSQRVANARARQQARAAAGDYTAQSRSVWDREKEAAANTIADAAGGAGKKRLLPAIQEFAGRLAANMRKQIGALADASPGRPPLTDLQLIREGITNADKYQQVWEQTKIELRHRFANDEGKLAEVDNFFAWHAPVLFSEDAVDRVIRGKLAETQTKLGQLVTQHTTAVDATGRSVVDRIMADSGMTGPAADTLHETLARRWEALATAEKTRRLEALNKVAANGNSPPVTGKLQGMYGDLIKLSNLGALDTAKYFDLVKKKLGLPVLTPDIAREITRRANDLQKLPEGDLRDRAATQLLNYVVQQRGLHPLDVPLGIYISNLLSGIKTPAKILFENGTLLAAQTLSTLRNPDLLRHPIAFVAKPWAEGQLKGMLQSLEVLRSGTVTGVRAEGPRPASVLEQRPFGKYDWLNLWKYPLRIVAAAHVPLFKPAWELKQTAIAADLAKREGLRGPALVQRVADIMGNTPARVEAARGQALGELRGLGALQPRGADESAVAYGRRQASEGLDYRRRVYEILDQSRETAVPGITERARQYALHYTYLNEPYGLIGSVARMVSGGLQAVKRSDPVAAFAIKSQVPFATVASNIINEHLNWTPVGLARAVRSHFSGELYGEPITDPAARGDLYARAVAGTVLASGLAALVAKGLVQINGPGPAQPAAQKQWREAGNEPWSLTVGGRRYSYANTPMASSAAVLGAWNDFRQFGKGDDADANTRLAFALKAIASQALSLPMLTGLKDLIDATGNTSTGAGGLQMEKLLARTASTEVFPKWLRDIDQVFDPQVYDNRGAAAMLASQVPFVRRGTDPVLNRLGDPVQRQLFSGWTAPASQDPVWRAIVDKGAWIPDVPRDHIVGDKKRGPDFYRQITPDEIYDVVKETGPDIRDRIQRAIDLPTTLAGKTYLPFNDLDPAEAKELVEKITHEEEAKAYRRLR